MSIVWRRLYIHHAIVEHLYIDKTLVFEEINAFVDTTWIYNVYSLHL